MPELADKIRQAMSSKKFAECLVNSSLRHDFEGLLIRQPDVDLNTACVPLLVEATRSDKELPGKLGSIQNFYTVVTPFSKLPEIVEDPEVLKIEYSTSRFVTDE